MDRTSWCYFQFKILTIVQIFLSPWVTIPTFPKMICRISIWQKRSSDSENLHNQNAQGILLLMKQGPFNRNFRSQSKYLYMFWRHEPQCEVNFVFIRLPNNTKSIPIFPTISLLLTPLANDHCWIYCNIKYWNTEYVFLMPCCSEMLWNALNFQKCSEMRWFFKKFSAKTLHKNALKCAETLRDIRWILLSFQKIGIT